MVYEIYCSISVRALDIQLKSGKIAPGTQGLPGRQYWRSICCNIGCTGNVRGICRGSGTLVDTTKSRSQSQSSEVAVVGGSAAGLFTASLLARQGRAVRVFERAEKLDPPSRTLIVTNRMRQPARPVAERSIVNEIKRFELFTDGRSAMVPLQEPDLIIERAELIHGLAREAQDHGARLEIGCRFASLGAKAPACN